jgi:hypothetical protein
MKNIYKHISHTLMVLGILLLTATGCGSEDKKDSPNETLQGLWRVTEIIVDTTAVNVTAGDEIPEASDSITTYPDSNGKQPYIRFKASTYDYFEVSPTDTTTQETGAYTLANNEITTQPSGKSAMNFGYEITGNKLIMIESNSDSDIFYYAEKVVVDPFLPEEPSNNEETENPNEEEVTGCAINHDTVNALLGSSLNPIIIETGIEITDTLYAIEGRNGYEARYYLQVEPYTAFRIKILDIITTYPDVHNLFKYTTISATADFSTDQFLFNTEMEEGVKTLNFDIYTTTSCLYIEFFSYQKEVQFKFVVEDLSGTQE